jgi:hypothetical protein
VWNNRYSLHGGSNNFIFGLKFKCFDPIFGQGSMFKTLKNNTYVHTTQFKFHMLII